MPAGLSAQSEFLVKTGEVTRPGNVKIAIENGH